ncbi:MAG: 50S ribosomal protein L35 [Acidimicrobiia bacterium]
MPKMKTHRGAAKRFKLTSTGKIRRGKANRQRHFEQKSSGALARDKHGVEVVGADKQKIERLLGKR